MGHYDSCYEADKEFENEKWREKIEKEFLAYEEKLTPHQKSFINTIMKDVEKWMIFVEVLKKLK